MGDRASFRSHLGGVKLIMFLYGFLGVASPSKCRAGLPASQGHWPRGWGWLPSGLPHRGSGKVGLVWSVWKELTAILESLQ